MYSLNLVLWDTCFGRTIAHWTSKLWGMFELSVSVTDSLCLWQTVYVYDRQFLSVKDNLCLSEKVSVCHRLYVSLTNSLCFFQRVCFCHRLSLFVTDSLCPSQKVLVCQSLSLSNTLLDHSCQLCLPIYTGFSSRNVCEISVCPRIQSQHSKHCEALIMWRVCCQQVGQIYLIPPQTLNTIELNDNIFKLC